MSFSPAQETVGLDRLLDILCHTHRRQILTRLSDRDSRDEDEFDQRAPGISTESLANELFHYHLQKMAEADFIYWDPERRVVRRGPRFDEIAPLIDLMANHNDELPTGWL